LLGRYATAGIGRSARNFYRSMPATERKYSTISQHADQKSDQQSVTGPGQN
jgi:hypothetical protein